MGSRGPIPKRKEELRRRNKSEEPDTTITLAGAVKRVPCPSGLHADARQWYQSLAHSGQSKYYEPSDWRQARVLAIILSGMLNAPRPSAQLFSAWCSAAAELGTTEGARRRMKIEIKRGGATLEPVSDIEAYRRAREA